MKRNISLTTFLFCWLLFVLRCIPCNSNSSDSNSTRCCVRMIIYSVIPKKNVSNWDNNKECNKTIKGRVHIWRSLLAFKTVLWMKKEDCKERLLCFWEQTVLWKQTLKGFHLWTLLKCWKNCSFPLHIRQRNFS